MVFIHCPLVEATMPRVSTHRFREEKAPDCSKSVAKLQVVPLVRPSLWLSATMLDFEEARGNACNERLEWRHESSHISNQCESRRK